MEGVVHSPEQVGHHPPGQTSGSIANRLPLPNTATGKSWVCLVTRGQLEETWSGPQRETRLQASCGQRRRPSLPREANPESGWRAASRRNKLIREAPPSYSAPSKHGLFPLGAKGTRRHVPWLRCLPKKPPWASAVHLRGKRNRCGVIPKPTLRF